MVWGRYLIFRYVDPGPSWNPQKKGGSKKGRQFKTP